MKPRHVASRKFIAGRADVFITSNIEGSTLVTKFPVVKVAKREPRFPLTHRDAVAAARSGLDQLREQLDQGEAGAGLLRRRSRRPGVCDLTSSAILGKGRATLVRPFCCGTAAMKLDHHDLARGRGLPDAQSSGIILPVGSTEQHGPMGLIGTDSFCAEAIAERAAESVQTPLSRRFCATRPRRSTWAFRVRSRCLRRRSAHCFSNYLEGLASHGFARLFVLNAHGANLATDAPGCAQSFCEPPRWHDPQLVGLRRRSTPCAANIYGDWEGLHATPAEISITQALLPISCLPGAAASPSAAN